MTTYEAWLTISPPGYGEQVSVSLTKPSDVLSEQGWVVKRMVEAPTAQTVAEAQEMLRELGGVWTGYETAGRDDIEFINAQVEELEERILASVCGTASPGGAPTYADLVSVLTADAETMERWADESRAGSWSTHQVDANRRRASDIRALLSRIPQQQEGTDR